MFLSWLSVGASGTFLSAQVLCFALVSQCDDVGPAPSGKGVRHDLSASTGDRTPCAEYVEDTWFFHEQIAHYMSLALCAKTIRQQVRFAQGLPRGYV